MALLILAITGTAVSAQSLTVERAAAMAMDHNDSTAVESGLADEAAKSVTEKLYNEYRDRDGKLGEMQATDDPSVIAELEVQLASIEARIRAYEEQLDQSYESMSKYSAQYEAQKETAELNCYNCFAAIISAEKAYEIYEVSLDIAKRNLRIAEVKYGLGMINKADYDKEKVSHDKKVLERKTKQAAIDRTYDALRNYLGYDIRGIYTVSPDLAYTELGSREPKDYKDLAYRNQNVIDKQKALDEAKSGANPAGESARTLELKAEKAQKAYDDAFAAAEQKIAGYLNEIKGIETNYESALLDLEAVKGQLVISEIKYGLGMIIELDVVNLRLQVMQQEESLRALVFEHEIKARQLMKGYL